jgi:hypothetical protein
MARRNIALLVVAIASLAASACADVTGPAPVPPASFDETPSGSPSRCGIWNGVASRC